MTAPHPQRSMQHTLLGHRASVLDRWIGLGPEAFGNWGGGEMEKRTPCRHKKETGEFPITPLGSATPHIQSGCGGDGT